MITRKKESSHSATSENAKTKAERVLHFGTRAILSLGSDRQIREVADSFGRSRQTIEYWAKKALKAGFLMKIGKYRATY